MFFCLRQVKAKDLLQLQVYRVLRALFLLFVPGLFLPAGSCGASSSRTLGGGCLTCAVVLVWQLGLALGWDGGVMACKNEFLWSSLCLGDLGCSCSEVDGRKRRNLECTSSIGRQARKCVDTRSTYMSDFFVAWWVVIEVHAWRTSEGDWPLSSVLLWSQAYSRGTNKQKEKKQNYESKYDVEVAGRHASREVQSFSSLLDRGPHLEEDSTSDDTCEIMAVRFSFGFVCCVLSYDAGHT